MPVSLFGLVSIIMILTVFGRSFGRDVKLVHLDLLDYQFPPNEEPPDPPESPSPSA